MAELLTPRGNVLVDVDNTINNLQVDLLRFANKRLPQRQPYHAFDNAAMESVDRPFDLIGAEFFDSPQLMGRTKPFIGALDAVRLLKESGFNVHVASGRQASTLYDTTMGWLEKHGFLPYLSSVSLRDSDEATEYFKLKKAKEIDALAAFEDTKTVAEILSNGGITVYLVRKPWNKQVKKTELIQPAPSFRRAVLKFLNSS